MTTVPRLGGRSPMASLMKVLLPQPKGPTVTLADLQADVLDGELAGRQHLLIGGEPDAVEIDE